MIQIYTGPGRGKTSAAFGLAIRGAMAGKKVYIGQFVKGMKYNETKVQNYIENIKIEQFGKNCFINEKPTKDDIKMAKKGFKKIIKNVSKYDILILDELTIALHFNLLDIDDVVKNLKKYKEDVEFIITGRKCPGKLIEIADLVTEMKEIKHYYQEGIIARNGFDK